MNSSHAIVQERRRSSLARALGPAIADALSAPDVVEAMVNADGQLWLDRVGQGLVATQHTLSAPDRETAIRILAHEAGEFVGEDRPTLAAILPLSAARVQALLPPLVPAPKAIASPGVRRRRAFPPNVIQVSIAVFGALYLTLPWHLRSVPLPTAVQAP